MVKRIKMQTLSFEFDGLDYSMMTIKWNVTKASYQVSQATQASSKKREVYVNVLKYLGSS